MSAQKPHGTSQDPDGTAQTPPGTAQKPPGTAEESLGSGKARRPYHHGNLREALLDAARDLLARVGPHGFTLADAARQAGVSAAAPYRHFADREALLREVAREGFAAFARDLSAALQSAPGAGKRGFRAMGDAYLAFARRQPGAYVAMFSMNAPLTTTPAGTSPACDEERSASDRLAFDILLAGLSGALAEDAQKLRVEPVLLATQIWSLSHGVATLMLAGRIDPRHGLDPGHLLESAVTALLRGHGASDIAS